MIKRTLFFCNPAYLCVRDKQLLVKRDGLDDATVPIEDVGFVVLDNRQITMSQALIADLLENGTAVITCDKKHLPTGLFLPLDGNTIQSERFQCQLESSIPLRKQLWQQTVQCKIQNQAAVLKRCKSIPALNMLAWASKVKSGDSDNREAVAAAYYWSELFSDIPNFTRDRYGVPPNNMLNYGYAILRGVVARALVGSGLLPVLGIHHHNRYNAYCLADDIMEPYRAFVDILVYSTYQQYGSIDDLTSEIKKELLSIPMLDVIIGNRRRPLMNAVSETASSLSKCFSGEIRKIIYPEIPDGEDK